MVGGSPTFYKLQQIEPYYSSGGVIVFDSDLLKLCTWHLQVVLLTYLMHAVCAYRLQFEPAPLQWWHNRGASRPYKSMIDHNHTRVTLMSPTRIMAKKRRRV